MVMLIRNARSCIFAACVLQVLMASYSVHAFVPSANKCQGSNHIGRQSRQLKLSGEDDCPNEGVVSSEVSLRTFIDDAKKSPPAPTAPDTTEDTAAAAGEATAQTTEAEEATSAKKERKLKKAKRSVEDALRIRAQKAEAALEKAKKKQDELKDTISEASRRGIRGSLKRLFRRDKSDELEQSKKSSGKTRRATPRATTSPPRSVTEQLMESANIEGEAATALDSIQLAKTTTADAFEEAEDDLAEVDRTLDSIRDMLVQAETRQEDARASLAEARGEASAALLSAEKAAAKALGQSQRAEQILTSLIARQGQENTASLGTSQADDEKIEEYKADGLEPRKEIDISSLSYDDIDYTLTEMAPPFIDENSCLVPGVPVVRVEKAPENSRRIFAGIDIMASVDDVWNVLTDYHHLQDVVPNLVVNDVLDLYELPKGETSPSNVPSDPSLSDEEKLEKISKKLRGSKLRQVGGAKVVGINFSARTTLEVREWPEGMPDFAHYEDDVYDGKSRNKRAKEGRGVPLKRYRFPRPFSLSSLPYRCVSMQSVEDDDGEFRMYQGVWRMQPLVGCAPPGEQAMRLTYAVEISPRPYLPVALVENRIAKDLCRNLESIRDFVS